MKKSSHLTRSSLLFAFALLGNFFAWFVLNPSETPRDFHGKIQGIGYTPHRSIQSYDELSAHPEVSIEQIERDFKILDGKVDNVRTYSVTHGQEKVPMVAQKHHMKVMAGAWLNRDDQKNRQEINTVIDLAARYNSINHVLLGNEVLWRKELSVQQMIAYLDQAREQVQQPVSIGELWDIWEKYPELAKHVDFIAVHIFPYWMGMPIEKAIEEMHHRYRRLQQLFPDKEIVIAEAGWPSKGGGNWDAKASLRNEARFLREFVNLAKQKNYDYYIMEAFDQPWKHSTEGTASEYWGIFDAIGRQKFPFTGAVTENPWWLQQAIAAACIF